MDVVALNNRIAEEKDLVVRAEFYARRSAVLDQYRTVKEQADLGAAYMAALDEYISTVREQGKVARMHAGSIVAFSQATPAAATLVGAVQDQELQNGVLDIVARKKGQPFADRVKGMLGKATNAIDIKRSLSGN